MKIKVDRNKRLYAYWNEHPGMTYQAIANLFHISKPRAWFIINQEKNDENIKEKHGGK